MMDAKTRDICERAIETHKEIEDCLAVSIKLNHQQVDDLVVSQMMRRYKSLHKSTNISNWAMAKAFHDALRFYISEDEFQAMLKEPQDE